MGASLPVVPLFAKSLGAGLAITGTVVALTGLGPVVFSIPAGLLISRFGVRQITIAIITAMLVTAIGTALSRSVVQLAIMRFISGALQSALVICRVSYMRQILAPEQRGRAIAAIGGTMRIGRFVGPIAGGFLAQKLGFPAVFWAQALLTLPAVLLSTSKLQGIDREAEKGDTLKGLSEFAGLISNYKKTFLTAGITVFSLGLLRSSQQLVIPLWGDHLGLDVAQIGLIIGLASALDMILFYPAGIIMDKMGRKWAVLPCLIFMSISFGLLPLSTSFAGLLVVALLNGFGNGIGSGIVMTMGSDYAPKNATMSFLGVWFMISGAGSLIGPEGVGAIAEAVALGLAPLVIAAIGLGGALFTLIFVKEPLKSKARGTIQGQT